MTPDPPPNMDLVVYQLKEIHEDIKEIKKQVTLTNGRVNKHDIDLARVQGELTTAVGSSAKTMDRVDDHDLQFARVKGAMAFLAFVATLAAGYISLFH